MEFTEEDLARSPRNVSEDRRVQAPETFRDLEEGNVVLERGMDSFEDDLASMGVGRGASARSSVSQPLDPDLWSTLPLELLHIVFAHLPLVDIVRLRVLSTTWNRYVSGDMLGFTKVCAEVNPMISGMISNGSDDYDDGLMAVMLPGSGTSWFRYLRTSPMEPGYDHTINVGDGGLVCIVLFSSCVGLHPRIVVRNPLTCRERALPGLPQPIRLLMVQLVMDRDLKCYRVLVLGSTPAIQAHVFCSVVGKWRSPEASDGIVFGYHHHWMSLKNPDQAHLMSRLPCVYDCASGKLVDLDDVDSPWKAPNWLPYPIQSSLKNNPQPSALVKDRLFVLHEAVLPRQGSCFRYLISEYQARRERPYWVKLRDHSCGMCEVASVHEYSRHLYACRDFLLVTAISGLMVVLEYDLAWVYEIASEKWREIDDVELEIEEILEDKAAMIELQWDAVP